MFNIFKKTVSKPLSKLIEIQKETKVETTDELECLEVWMVSWTAVNGEFSSDKQKTVRAFTSKNDAEKFANMLKEGFKLARSSWLARQISVYKES